MNDESATTAKVYVWKTDCLRNIYDLSLKKANIHGQCTQSLVPTSLPAKVSDKQWN